MRFSSFGIRYHYIWREDRQAWLANWGSPFNVVARTRQCDTPSRGNGDIPPPHTHRTNGRSVKHPHASNNSTVLAFNSCTKRVGRIHDRAADFHPVSFELYIVHVGAWHHNWRSFDSQATWVIDVLRLFRWHVIYEFCTTRRRQTSSRLAQKLNVCTVNPIVLLSSELKAADNNEVISVLGTTTKKITCANVII